jgi:ribosome-associated protein
MTDSGTIDIAPGVWLAESELEEQFIRSSGPGGQNVNKVATAVQLRFDARNAEGLPGPVKARLFRIAGQRATKDGEILIEASRFRTQERNREDARERLFALIAEAAKPPPPPRKKTRPSRGAVEKRLKAKAGRSRVKKMRGRVDPE